MFVEFALMCESPWLIELLWRAEVPREFMSLAAHLEPSIIAEPQDNVVCLRVAGCFSIPCP
jgi:hypothetical protein